LTGKAYFYREAHEERPESRGEKLCALGVKNTFCPSTSRPYLDLRTTRTTFGMLKERDVQIHRHFRFIIKAEK
jgi:hypothetical protein